MADADTERFRIMKVLIDDLGRCAHKLEDQAVKDEHPFWLRMSFRAFFGLTEGWVSVSRRILFPKMIARFGTTLIPDSASKQTFDSLMAATEHLEWVLNERGEAELKKRKLGLKANFKACFRIQYIYFGGTKAEADAALHGPGWEAFQRAIKIRDGLMHPHDPADLILQDKAADDFKNAFSLILKVIHHFEEGTTRLASL